MQGQSILRRIRDNERITSRAYRWPIIFMPSCNLSIQQAPVQVPQSISAFLVSMRTQRICQRDVQLSDRVHSRWQHSGVHSLGRFVSVEADPARTQRKDCVVLAQPDIVAGPPFGTSLPHDDAASLASLPMEQLHTEPLCLRSFPILGRPSSFLHGEPHTRGTRQTCEQKAVQRSIASKQGLVFWWKVVRLAPSCGTAARQATVMDAPLPDTQAAATPGTTAT
jgi:hypothetical protein